MSKSSRFHGVILEVFTNTGGIASQPGMWW